MIRSSIVTVSTTPAPMLGYEDDAIVGRSVMFTVPEDGQTVKVGGPDLTWDDGYPLGPGVPYSTDLDPGEDVWLVVQAGTQQINVLWRGV